MTYSSRRSRRPCQRRSYRSRTRAAFRAKSGSRGKIHDRCCHGLIASAANQRRTVEPDSVAVMPRVTASSARSVLDQRDSGTPCSAGNEQARAFTSALTVAANTGGRPERARSVRPSRPWAANLPRHVRTVSTCRPRSRAIWALCWPSAAASTIQARWILRSGALRARAKAPSSARSWSVRLIRTGEVAMVMPPLSRDTARIVLRHAAGLGVRRRP